MLKTIIRLFRGYVCVELKGSSQLRFLNICRAAKYKTWDHHIENDNIQMKMYLSDFKKVHAIYKKTHTYPHIISKFGLPFEINKMFRLKTLLPGIVLTTVIVLYMSSRLLNIGIYGLKKHNMDDMLAFLKKCDIKETMAISAVDCNDIENRIRNEFKDISWVSASICGCDLTIKVVEGIDTSEYLKNDEVYSGIVAENDGVVDSIITTCGTPMVHKGDKVKKGQELISGIIRIYGDDESLLNSRPVCAGGNVVVKTRLKYKDSFALSHKVKSYSGKEKKALMLGYGDEIFLVQNPLNAFKKLGKYDIIENKYGHVFIWGTKTYKEYKVAEETYSEYEAKITAKRRYDAWLNKLKEKSVVICSDNVSFTVKKGLCIGQGYVTALVPQTKRRILSINDWRVDNSNEHGRKDN